MKNFLLAVSLLATVSGHTSETVTCSKDYTGIDLHPAYQLKKLTIKHEPYTPGSSLGGLSAKGQIGYAGVRSQVKRIHTLDSLTYKSILLDGFLLVLKEIQDGKYSGELTLNQGTALENKINDLTCVVNGELPAPKMCEQTQANLDHALYHTLLSADLDDARFALECGANPNYLSKRGCTPLLLLLDASCGATKGNSAFSYPPYNQTQMASILIDSGANIESIDPKNQQTALHKATLAGNDGVASMLIDLEANLDAQDINKETALMYAVKTNNYFLVKDLVNANANLNLKNRFGKTAFDLAKDMKRIEIAKLLIPVKRVISVEGNLNNVGCSISTLELVLDEPVEIVLKASKRKMFLLESLELGLELMAMPNEEVKARFTPTRTGVFKFMCGTHGGPIDQQTIGTISVN